ncbi:MAG: hypothetical protein WBF33_04445 [Candidatus Nitrosopolaris sp.]
MSKDLFKIFEKYRLGERAMLCLWVNGHCNPFSDCNEVARNLEQTLDMQIGRLELSSKGEWVIRNPLAKAITKEIGRVTVDGIGMINASLPNRHGEFEYYDPRAAAEFLEMPARLARLEEHMENVLKLVKQQSSEDKSGGIMAEGENT